MTTTMRTFLSSLPPLSLRQLRSPRRLKSQLLLLLNLPSSPPGLLPLLKLVSFDLVTLLYLLIKSGAFGLYKPINVL
jgi:hypothetical protein